MTCRIERTVQPRATVFRVSGAMDAVHAQQLEALLRQESEGRVLVDWHDITLVHRDAIRCLARIEASGVDFLNCPEYVRRSMASATEEPW